MADKAQRQRFISPLKAKTERKQHSPGMSCKLTEASSSSGEPAGCQGSEQAVPAHLGEEVEAAQAAHDAVHLGQALPFPFWLKGNSNSSAEKGGQEQPSTHTAAALQNSFCCSPPTLMSTKVLKEHPAAGAASCPKPISPFLGTILTLPSASQGLAPPQQHRMGNPRGKVTS